MYHHAIRTRDHRLAFTTWEEGLRLWSCVVSAAPGLVALCVMPDHIHLLAPGDVRVRLTAGLAGYARWRNRRRGETGALWQRADAPSEVPGPLKIRRNIRYIHLNPCRAGLVADPLAWPLSTHMDAVGLCLEPALRKRTDPVRFHAHVSGDPSVRPEGTELPFAMVDTPDVAAIADAVSMATRTPMDGLRRRGRARTLLVGAARVLTSASVVEIADYAAVQHPAVYRTRPIPMPSLRVLERWIGDPRATPLDDRVLAELLRRSRYRGAR